ncbi:hypothetical protein IQ230_07695 [Gloeocapsopsis crepidinum LEGE 06123]|uniref:Lipid/polyisoprenoid-binding YceI-like domain-containing protein n=1 Tax=Gloeocapsopsis crepidinum LEGE 06123 TaxID=588587 RepID=A0ABR9UPM9_9CHRO|nr:hypothetical protein [Gloeocapsopsis crepidinum]MBE9190245.1 hypothetical protein [Gloeocapsopsis crepidinum LEGE 06123]
MFKVIGTVIAFLLFPQVILAQDPLCYVEWRGEIIDLSSSICNKTRIINKILPNRDKSKPQIISLENIRFSEVTITPTADKNILEIKGNLTNESNLAGVLPVIQLNVFDQRNNQVVASTSVSIEAGDGIDPGEQMSFTKMLHTSTFNHLATLTNLKVKVISSN